MEDLKRWMYQKKRIQFKSQNSKSKSLNPSQKIAFVIDGRNETDLRNAQKYLKRFQEKGKEVSLIFLTEHAEPEKISFQAFNKKSFTWYRIPKAPVLMDFVATPFDLLICFNMEDVPELYAISDLSAALFKIGLIPGESEIFDLVINPVHEQGWNDYFRLLDRTLEQLSLEPVLV